MRNIRKWLRTKIEKEYKQSTNSKRKCFKNQDRCVQICCPWEDNRWQQTQDWQFCKTNNSFRNWNTSLKIQTKLSRKTSNWKIKWKSWPNSYKSNNKLKRNLQLARLYPKELSKRSIKKTTNYKQKSKGKVKLIPDRVKLKAS
jgi:hypothetical protein